MRFDHILQNVRQYYSEKIERHGATAQGVDWKSVESQMLRFEQLLKIWDNSTPFSVNDYGCGYGALIDYLVTLKVEFEYNGADLSESMIACARELHGQRSNCHFFADAALLPFADYTIASGIFNVKQESHNAEWERYVLDVLGEMSAKSARGFAFNALTLYSDPEKRRTYLYYGDPLFYFDYCKRYFSPRVTLLHDYPLYEFTILVKKAEVS
jgi:SAM-dependent methyltransferase